MAIQIFNGLISLGGILTETYYRKTIASQEARTELGLDPTKDYNASIGIASVNEYVMLTKTNLLNNVATNFDLTNFNQSFELLGVQSSNLNQDIYWIGVLNVAGQTTYRYYVNKNLGFYPIPRVVIPKSAKIEIVPGGAMASLTVLLKPCAIIADSIPASPV